MAKNNKSASSIGSLDECASTFLSELSPSEEANVSGGFLGLLLYKKFSFYESIKDYFSKKKAYKPEPKKYSHKPEPKKYSHKPVYKPHH
ncbi:MAG: hypothetical protein ABG776_00985 [Cyanobacteria bacterium J06555_13]